VAAGRAWATGEETARGHSRVIGEETARGRASGATGEENGEGGGEACSGDGDEVCSGAGQANGVFLDLGHGGNENLKKILSAESYSGKTIVQQRLLIKKTAAKQSNSGYLVITAVEAIAFNSGYY
jgi:hypothetical protein